MPHLSQVADAEGADDLLYGMLVIGSLVGLVAAQQLYRAHKRWLADKRAVRLSLQRSYCCGSEVRTSKRAVLACAEMMAGFDARKGSPSSPYQNLRRRSSFRQPLLESVCELDGLLECEVHGQCACESCAVDEGRERRCSTDTDSEASDCLEDQVTDSLRPESPRPDSPRTPFCADSPTRMATAMPHVVVLGERQAAAQATVIDRMVALAQKHGVELHVHEGLPQGLDEMDALYSQIGAALMICDAALGAPLAEALTALIEQLKTKTLPAVLTLVQRNRKPDRGESFAVANAVPEQATPPREEQLEMPLGGHAARGTNLWCLFARCVTPPRRRESFRDAEGESTGGAPEARRLEADLGAGGEPASPAATEADAERLGQPSGSRRVGYKGSGGECCTYSSAEGSEGAQGAPELLPPPPPSRSLGSAGQGAGQRRHPIVQPVLDSGAAPAAPPLGKAEAVLS